MAGKPRQFAPLLIAAALLLAGILLSVGVWQRSTTPPVRQYQGELADLGEAPDWSELEAYAGLLTREEFEAGLGTVYTINEAWRPYIEFHSNGARIRTSFRDPHQSIVLPLATSPARTNPPRYWRPAADLPAAPPDKPLAGLKIAIDPGHIGGAFAKIEERWFQVESGTPVMEGELTLRTARHLKTRLEALGAKVDLVRAKNAPVSTGDTMEFETYARTKLHSGSPEDVRTLAERLFYRTAEIRARAAIINDELEPDLVLCLHFNAENWGGSASNPRLSGKNHFHLLLNGAYTPAEIAHDDERFEMLQRLLQGIHQEELAIARTLAPVFAAETGLPPYAYKPDSSRALPLGKSPYIWARNLLANRLYRCPVLFLEPYVMNSKEVHARIQAGDYPGEKLVQGRLRKSIYREYADAVARGLEKYYQSSRNP
jgi:N-acetylmuramoyl-L-alanine amidase